MHDFCSNLLGLLLEKYILTKKNANQIFLKFGYVFIKAVIGKNLNILNILCLIMFPSSTLSETDHCLSVKHIKQCIYYCAVRNSVDIVFPF